MYIKTFGCRSTNEVCELRKPRYQADAVNCVIDLTELVNVWLYLIRGSGGIGLHVLGVSTRCRWTVIFNFQSLYSLVKIARTHGIWGWMDSHSVSDYLNETKRLPSAGNRTTIPCPGETGQNHTRSGRMLCNAVEIRNVFPRNNVPA
jgi:hypothetical protein